MESSPNCKRREKKRGEDAKWSRDRQYEVEQINAVLGSPLQSKALDSTVVHKAAC